MANKFKKALAYTLVAANIFTYVAPASQLIIPASIVMAAEETVPDITIDAALTSPRRMAVGVIQTVNLPTATTETIDGVLQNVSYEVTSSDETIVKVTEAEGKVSYKSLKGGKATVTITKYVAEKKYGKQDIEITVEAKSEIGLTQVGAVETIAPATANDVVTYRVYEGEVLVVNATTNTAADKIKDVNDFASFVDNGAVAELATEASKEEIGAVNPRKTEIEKLAGQVYTANFIAKKPGKTVVTISQAAAVDSSTSASSIQFNIEVIRRDGVLGVSYDADRDGKAEEYAADKYNAGIFTTGEETAKVALDLVKNKEFKINAISAGGDQVRFESSTPAVASVDNTGNVKALSAGTTKISAIIDGSATSKFLGSKIEINVTVTEKEVAYITISGDAEGTTVGDADGRIEIGSVDGEGKAIVKDNDSALAAIRNKEEKTLILSTVDKKNAVINIASNAGSFLEIKSDDPGKVTVTNDGRIEAKGTGAAVITLAYNTGADIQDTAEIKLHVYVADVAINNIITVDPVSVDPISKTATIKPVATAGEVKIDTDKLYKLNDKNEFVEDAETKAFITVTDKGVVTYDASKNTKNVSGTTYVRTHVENDAEKKIFGSDYAFAAVRFSAAAANELKVTGAEKDLVKLTAGDSAIVNVSATDNKTTFTLVTSDPEVASATIENGMIIVNANAEGTALITVKGAAGTAGYANPEAYTFAVQVSAKAEEPVVTELKANPIKVTVKTATIKASKVKKAKATIAAKKVFTVKKAKGKVTYTKKSGSKNLSISKSGKITVKKGTKAGTYKMKVTIKAAGNESYAAKKVTKTITVKVKK